jgi:hypothetical protein
MALSGRVLWQIAGFCEHGNEPLCFIKFEESLDHLMKSVSKEAPSLLKSDIHVHTQAPRRGNAVSLGSMACYL